jgi:hypothetical protein
MEYIENLGSFGEYLQRNITRIPDRVRRIPEYAKKSFDKTVYLGKRIKTINLKPYKTCIAIATSSTTPLTIYGLTHIPIIPNNFEGGITLFIIGMTQALLPLGLIIEEESPSKKNNYQETLNKWIEQ